MGSQDDLLLTSFTPIEPHVLTWCQISMPGFSVCLDPATQTPCYAPMRHKQANSCISHPTTRLACSPEPLLFKAALRPAPNPCIHTC